MKEDSEQNLIYRSFIYSKIGFNCETDASCCTHFVHDGPRVNDTEKAEIVRQLRETGFEEIAEFIKQKNTVPIVEKQGINGKCSLLSENLCILHKKAKPQVCIDFPIFVYEKNGIINAEIDTACKYISNSRCENKYLRPKGRNISQKLTEQAIHPSPKNKDILAIFDKFDNLARDFRKKFNKKLSIKATNSIEQRINRFYE